MQKITSSIYSFERIREENYLYIDKTEYLWNLVQNVGESYFLARPRRFGKSLTISTLKAIFEGKNHLFEGLAISKKDYDWKSYPVIHLDMGNCDGQSAQKVRDYLSDMLNMTAKQFGVSIEGRSVATRFEKLVRDIAGDGNVVILVDEYDKPILGSLGTRGADGILSVLKGFYSTIKKCNAKERFVFITGVSKFSHVSMFSGFNNPTDISMHCDFATMLGYTQCEFETEFAEYISVACQQTGMKRQDLLTEIKQWYNGYRFHAKAESVYNPVSLAKFFESRAEFNNYWFSTGTPAFLMKLVKEKDFSIEKTLTESVPSFAFDAFEIDQVDPLTLLLQTGYLTIKSTELIYRKTWYKLGFPNHEVEASFNTCLLNAYTAVDKELTAKYLVDMALSVRSGNADRFMNCVKTYLAGIPYDIQLANEKYYQTVFFLLFQNLNMNIACEVRTNNGRIDAVAEDGDFIYIFEFKLNPNAGIAMTQIKEKEYYLRFRNSGKNIVLIGANFDTEKRQLSDWKIENA